MYKIGSPYLQESSPSSTDNYTVYQARNSNAGMMTFVPIERGQRFQSEERINPHEKQSDLIKIVEVAPRNSSSRDQRKSDKSDNRKKDYNTFPKDDLEVGQHGGSQSESCCASFWHDYRRTIVGAALATAGTCIAGAVVGGVTLWLEYSVFASK